MEIENFRRSPEAAYIDDGLDSNTADKFATKEAISAMTTKHENLNSILKAGNLYTIDSVIEE